MGLLWWMVAVVVAVLVVISVVDLFRRHLSTGATVAWLIIIVVLPMIGSIVYWAMRKPTAEDFEHTYEAEADMRQRAASKPFDSTM
jgi:cell division protein FtsX